MLCVVTVPSIKTIDNRTWKQYDFIQEEEDNNQYKVRDFNSYYICYMYETK